MNSGYYPVVAQHRLRVQTQSQQPPFYLGGSQVPTALDIIEKPKKDNIKHKNKIYNLK